MYEFVLSGIVTILIILTLICQGLNAFLMWEIAMRVHSKYLKFIAAGFTIMVLRRVSGIVTRIALESESGLGYKITLTLGLIDTVGLPFIISFLILIGLRGWTRHIWRPKDFIQL